MKSLAASGSIYRIGAEHANRLRPWYRQTRILGWAITVPFLGLLLWVHATEGLSTNQKTGFSALIGVAVVLLNLSFAKWRFRRFFPDAQRLPRNKNFFAVQAEHPFYRSYMVPMLAQAGFVDALILWGVWGRPGTSIEEIVLLAFALAYSAYFLIIAAYRFKDWSRERTAAPD